MKLMTAAAMAASLVAGAAQAQSFCVYEPTGAQGLNYAFAKDYALAAKSWGVNLALKAYTDERVASEDFKAGQCDGIVITGLRGRQYNTYVGSIDSIGGVPSYRHLRTVLQVLASPQSEANMKKGAYEVVGIFPLGAAYVFVRDRSINSIEKAAGKKIAVLDFDKSQAKLVQQLGAQPVSSDITNFTAKFNNGQVDIVAAPGIAFKPFEMYKGLGTKGAIYRFPLLQLTVHMIVRSERFPTGFGQKSRAFVLTQLDRADATIKQAEDGIPAKYWLDLTSADKEKYTVMMLEARIQLTQDGIYDPRMMNLLKKVRCKIEPGAAECVDTIE
ncbi:MAG: putative solute-binding protein [Pseudomonadota bacterium]